MRLLILAVLLAGFAVAAVSADVSPTATRPAVPAVRSSVLAYPLPPRGYLSARARALRGPRVMAAEETNGRSLTMFGNARASRRVLVVGCANGMRCGGTDVVRAAMVGCPPPDAELWYLATLDPQGADLDLMPDHPGAQAFRQAVADLRPTVVVVFRTGDHALVRGGPQARRYARLAGLRYAGAGRAGLATWATGVVPHTDAVTVELPGGRASERAAVRLAHAIDRLAGTRFAAGADQDRRRMIAAGRDPRAEN